MGKATSKRSFKVLKESMTAEEFKCFCKKIALEYANTRNEYARSYFKEQYKISVGCFYSILETAVINNWVSEEDVNRMEAKALANQKAHAEEAGISTRVHYANLRKKRNEYLLCKYSDEEMEKIAVEFATNTEMSKKQFADKLGLPTIVVDLLLKKVIVEAIVDDKTFIMIKERSIVNTPDEKKKTVIKFFDELFRQRNSTISKSSS